MTHDREHAKHGQLEWPMSTPSHWPVDRLKWSVAGLINGTWGEEPDGVDDIICIRVADFDRTRFAVVDSPPTFRAVEEKARSNRLLHQGDLLIEKSGGGDNQPVGCVVEFDHTFDAVCSNFIGRMTVMPEMWPRYWTYVHASLYSGRLNVPAIKQTTGIQNLDTGAYFNQRVPFPPLEEQRAIADYLDRETARLDALVAAKERLLDLLAEKRKALITRAVTRGIYLKATLRESGISWLGKIPAHWEVRRIAWLFLERDQRGEPELPLLEVSINSGVTLREFSEERIEYTAADFNTYKVARCGDIVFNKMRMWQGAVGVAPEDGLVSPDYVVAAPMGSMSSEYSGLLFRTAAFSAECARHSHGIVWDRLRLYWEGFRDITVPLPPKEEQLGIVHYVSCEATRLDHLRVATEQTIALLKERRAALIASAVTGKIDVGRAV
ncbi:MAG: restriction endonuclease subunit S [Syntrophobacteraceae bacterium]